MFKNEHLINRLFNFDLDVYQSGYQQCGSNYSFGPAVRSHYLIHYVISGRGVLVLNKKMYTIEAGQAFIIFPNEVSFYQADEHDPWKYTWIGFNGLKADLFIENLNIKPSSNPIIMFETEPLCFKELREIDEIWVHDEVKILGLLYLMFYDLLKQNTSRSINIYDSQKSKNPYADQAKDFISKNYYKKLSIEDIASHIGLNKSYLGNLFKATFNISIKAYILDLQMKKACQLLKDTNMSIYEVAQAVGYDDALQFSKIFKKHVNSSPKDYRKYAIYDELDLIRLW
ncbi:MAG: AraC family transcriptional regulator [Turicibacter sp.]